MLVHEAEVHSDCQERNTPLCEDNLIYHLHAP